MATKLQVMTELARQTTSELTNSYENWAGFLDSAAWLYKYPWHEQVIIYAQRPDAKACAPIELWNNTFHRWVNKGAKGIAIIDDSGIKPYLRYVFDISDTNTRRDIPFRLWTAKPEYIEQIIEELQNSFGETGNESLEINEQIMGIAINAVSDNYSDYYEELLKCLNGSALEDKNDDEISSSLVLQLMTSVSYTVLTRMGVDPKQYFKESDFEYISLFNTPDTIAQLGGATSDISEMILREMERSVRSIEREQRHTLANEKTVLQNDNRKIERSNKYGTDILAERGLSDTRLDNGQAADGEHRQIRDDEENLPQGTQERDIQLNAASEQAHGTSLGNRQDSTGAGRADNGADVEDRGRGREAEIRESDEMGRLNEQHQTLSGGNGTDGVDLQITNEQPTEAEGEKLPAFLSEEIIQSSLFPTVPEQLSLIENDNETKVISQAELDSELVSGSGFQDGKYRIHSFYQTHPTSDATIAFLKKEYGIGGHSHTYLDGSRGFANHDAKGLHFENYETKADYTVSWKVVHERLKELISLDRYLSPKEKEYLPVYEQEQEEITAQRAEEQYIREALRKTAADMDNRRKDAQYHYSLGDTVTIGTSELTILGYDDTNVVLSDPKYPLLTQDMSREVFDRRLRDSNANDHLLVNADIRQSDSVNVMFEQAEQISKSAEVELYERFSVIETDGEFEDDSALYAIWDDLNDGYYVDENEITETFLTEYDAESYLERLKKKTDDKDAAEWLTVEKSKVSSKPVKDENEQEDIIGKEISIDNRKFVIESISNSSGDVSMRDITFQNQMGFPINRIEKIGKVREWLFAQENEPLAPTWEKKSDNGLRSIIIDLTAKEPSISKYNFHITDDELGYGGAKAKYRMNIDAINTLKKIEFENRFATPEEQVRLSKYVGWGGIPQAFEEGNPAWANEFLELNTTLSPEEYASARESTLNAHYTSPTVIKAIYSAIDSMGFQSGNILEPAMGIGNFFGLLPENMQKSKLYGVELDNITGRIAQQLYQNANITIQGFEKTSLPDSFFDVAIGNVPFGNFGVLDKRYDKNKFLIHDFFFAKALDKVRPGGIVAFITSSGTMDKKSSSVRKYIAQRAELLGAVRLPNNTFLQNAGTQVVADIIFLQKRDRALDIEPDWVHLGKSAEGFTINQYFVDNPDMVLGQLTEQSTMYGAQECTCIPIEGADLSEQLKDAIANIHAEITEYEREDESIETTQESIPADPNVRNFSFTIVDGQIYYRENSRMNKMEVSVTAANRIKGMVEIRDCTRRLIEYQLEGYADEAITQEQQNLNALYDRYTKKYGNLSSRANNMAFSDDSAYCLLCALEVIDENGNLERKSDMFTKRTIRQQTEITSVDTASEALTVSLAEKAKIDMPFMAQLSGKTEEQLANELTGQIFRLPVPKDELNNPQYVTADEYLSGNVRNKLERAIIAAEEDDIFAANVAALEKVQPVYLTASEIDVRLGATWVSANIVEQFTHELLQPSYYARNKIRVHFAQLTATWNIEGKSSDYENVAANVTYGTSRINAYKIIEETLNLKDIRIFDTITDEQGNEIRALNKKETILAQQKQQIIKDKFRDWIWVDPTRRENLTAVYNIKFNSNRPREYDGSHINFVGMNPAIQLRAHQVNAIARTLYGGNTLLAHVVGAGKTFEMVAAAMESKRLGLCQKSLFVVPNHLTEQWSAEFLQLYPSANILVATKKDFETRNRKKFCGRIATGDYDAVIIGHSQFEKIPMSVGRQRAVLEEQIQEITEGIAEAKNANSERFTVKQLEKTRKNIKLKLDKLNDQSRKDDIVTFEELGVDRLFVDEAHFYKNLFLFTKMRNVAGLAQTEAQKSSDLFIKCRYMDELTNGRGIVFATGTPISNSMTEMYTMQRYLQYATLQRQALTHFDAWASTFGETVTAIELAPEGTGYRAKTRFARFYNLPELISMFKDVADIQVADMLNLPVPEVDYHNVAVEPSEYQREMVASLAERAEKVRSGSVDPTVDNMLKITNDGRKLALDQRLINNMLPDSEESKVNACMKNIYRVWEQHGDKNLTQLIFCDLSTPHYDGTFNVYDDLKKKLIERDVPEHQIAYIHDAKTEVQKADLFAKVRSGKVRILLGSTTKMGAGTNVQKLLVAEHHLDIPWRPSDVGRILRTFKIKKNVEVTDNGKIII